MNIEALGYHSGFALCNAMYLGSVTAKEELLVPFCSFFDSNRSVVSVFEAETQTLAEQSARAAIRKEEGKWCGWCYGREGQVSLQGGGKSDAYVVESKLREMDLPITLILLFEYPFRPLGRLSINVPGTFREVFMGEAPTFQKAFIQGAKSHKLGGERWDEWESVVING